MPNMAVQKDSKINQLVNQLPEGLLVDAAWLVIHFRIPLTDIHDSAMRNVLRAKL